MSLKFHTSMRGAHACIAKCAMLLPFLQLRTGPGFNTSWAIKRSGDGFNHHVTSFGVSMESSFQKSCWGVTFRALMGFAGVLCLAYLFGSI
jgi:hypothetical protein